MITCCVEYDVSPAKLAEFERYAKLWIELVPRFGGTHHGYFLPSEGDSHRALCLFSFPSFAAYEQYRIAAAADPDCQAAIRFGVETGTLGRYKRSFFRPLLPEA
jgi:hypothetical protein